MKKLKRKYKWTEQELHFHSLNAEREYRDRIRKYALDSVIYGLWSLKEQYHPHGILRYINEKQWSADEVEMLKMPSMKILKGAPPTETSALEGETGTTNPAKTLFPLISDGLQLRDEHERFIILDKEKHIGKD